MAISSAVDATARARTVGIQTQYQNLRAGNVSLLPQRIAIIGQGASASTYATDPVQITSAAQAGTLFGFGSPVHLAALQLLPANGDGVGTIPVTIYPLEDDASGVAAAGDITPAGAATTAASYRVNVNNILSEEFVIEVGDTVADIVTAMTAAINAVLEMPVIASDDTTEVGIAAKWEGTSSNSIVLSVEGPTDAGITFAFTQPTGGLVNPDVSDATALIIDDWETLVLNCLEVGDTTNLDRYKTAGEARWEALVSKPYVVFTGTNEADFATAITVPDARPTDFINAQLVAPGSNNLPLVIAARQLARIAVVANENPPTDYGSQQATGLVPGTDAEQWTYAERDQAIKAGSSSIEVRDGVVTLADIVTFYHPTGETDPAYRYVVDIIKLMNILYNLRLIFDSPEWDGAPLIPDDQPTTNRAAKQPKMAVAAVATMIDSLGLEAIISNPEFAKTQTVAGINESNPKRLDLALTVQLSGNVNIISVDLNFGFFFGEAAIVN